METSNTDNILSHQEENSFLSRLEVLTKSLREIKGFLEKASKDPALAPKETKIKQLQAQIDAGTYKPDSKKIADKIVTSKNGQWSLK